jgi:hypothetical protein
VADATNPLTARVAVNRFWESIFGIGIVRTSEEFGAQSELPSHPDLLDWLATELVQSKWDIKHLLKLMVTSAAYRQSSRVTPELQAQDPENRLLARGPDSGSAEMIRDQAMFATDAQRKIPVAGAAAGLSARLWQHRWGDKHRRGSLPIARGISGAAPTHP